MRVSPLLAGLLLGSLWASAWTLWSSRSRPISHVLLPLLVDIVAVVALALAPDLPTVAVVVAALAAAHSVMGPADVRRVRLRWQVSGAALLTLAALMLHSGVSAWVPRVGVVVLVLALLLLIGLAPFLQPLQLHDPPALSAPSWFGLVGPTLFVVTLQHTVRTIGAEQGAILASLLVSFGLVNAGFGVLAAWRARDQAAAWHLSFVADWGLVLVAAGLLLLQGLAAAYLVLLLMLFCRLPLFLTARTHLLYPSASAQEPRVTPLALAAVAALAGAAPFAGFPARALLLRAAATLSWPLAALLLVGLLLWLLHSLQLARGLSLSRSQTPAIVAGLAAALLLGIWPGSVLGIAGLG